MGNNVHSHEIERLIDRLLGYCIRKDENDWTYWFNAKFYVDHIESGEYFLKGILSPYYKPLYDYIRTHKRLGSRKRFVELAYSTVYMS